MAALGAQTIASSYEQLLHTDTDGGGNGNTLVTIKDGDNGTTFGIKLATNKVEIIPGSNDANAFEVSQADGTAVLTVNTSTVGATLIGALTVGVDDAGHDVIFYGDTASSNMTWDTSADDLILNDSTLHIDQDDNANSILIDSESTSANILDIQAGALQTGNGMRIFSDSSHGGSRNLLLVINDDASATGTDVGFFLNTEVGTTETPPEGFVVESSLAANAVTNSKVADDAVTVSKMDSTSQSLSNRNLVKNGSMRVAQRGTSAITLSNAAVSYTLDRMHFYKANAGTQTVAQSTDAPPGFDNSLLVKNTSEDSSVTAADRVSLIYRFEGLDAAKLDFGTVNAKTVTLSWYVKSTVSG